MKLQAEYLRANFSGTCAGGGSYECGIDAYYANLAWLVTGERYADSYCGERLRRVRPKANFAPGKSCCGAWELGLRYSKFDAGISRAAMLPAQASFPALEPALPMPGFWA